MLFGLCLVVVLVCGLHQHTFTAHTGGVCGALLTLAGWVRLVFPASSDELATEQTKWIVLSSCLLHRAFARGGHVNLTCQQAPSSALQVHARLVWFATDWSTVSAGYRQQSNSSLEGRFPVTAMNRCGCNCCWCCLVLLVVALRRVVEVASSSERAATRSCLAIEKGWHRSCRLTSNRRGKLVDARVL